MTFALYRYGTLVERHQTLEACVDAAIKRGMAMYGHCGLSERLREGVEIVDEDGQLDLEEAIENA